LQTLGQSEKHVWEERPSFVSASDEKKKPFNIDAEEKPTPRTQTG
jgi:hypothetical protein